MNLSNKLAAADNFVVTEIQRIESEKRKETTAYIEGAYKGADLMYRAVKKEISEPDVAANRPQNLFERIKAMSIDEMAEFFSKDCFSRREFPCRIFCSECDSYDDAECSIKIKKALESEVENNA